MTGTISKSYVYLMQETIGNFKSAKYCEKVIFKRLYVVVTHGFSNMNNEYINVNIRVERIAVRSRTTR